MTPSAHTQKQQFPLSEPRYSSLGKAIPGKQFGSDLLLAPARGQGQGQQRPLAQVTLPAGPLRSLPLPADLQGPQPSGTPAPLQRASKPGRLRAASLPLPGAAQGCGAPGTGHGGGTGLQGQPASPGAAPNSSHRAGNNHSRSGSHFRTHKPEQQGRAQHARTRAGSPLRFTSLDKKHHPTSPCLTPAPR